MKKIVNVISILFIGCGLAIIFYPKISYDYAKKRQIEVIRDYKEKVDDIEDEKIKLEYEKAYQYNQEISGDWVENLNQENTGNKYEEILNVTNDGIMSYIEIPKIQVYLPVYHGTTEEKMKKGVGHLPKSSLPVGGNMTHCVLTGHTGLLRAEIFTRIDELEVGDFFYLNTLGKILSYQINQIKVVLPTEVEDLQTVEGKDFVTLVTCTPYGVNTHRLLVRGERVEEKKEGENEEKERSVEELYEQEEEQTNKYYLIGIFIVLLLFLGCIFLDSIVKYKKNKRK